jgi:hypothetical protein
MTDIQLVFVKSIWELVLTIVLLVGTGALPIGNIEHGALEHLELSEGRTTASFRMKF